MKYNCGKYNYRKIDFTAEQFLSAFGLSNSGKNKENVCNCNRILESAGFVSIQKWKDEKGHFRNLYFLDSKFII